MNKAVTILYYLVIIAFFTQPTFGQPKSIDSPETADESEVDTTFIKMNNFPQVDVIGRKPSLLNRIPGSADIITEASLKSSKPITGNEMFKKVTGINVVDEEGAGLKQTLVCEDLIQTEAEMF